MAADLTRIRGVLFDKDGTLISFEKTWGPALAAVIRHYAQGNDAIAADLAAISLFDLDSETFDNTSVAVSGTVEDFAVRWALRLGVEGGPAFFTEIDTLLRLAARTSLEPIGAPHEIIAHLVATNRVCGIATNDAEANAHEHAEVLAVSRHLSFVAGYDSGHGSKPEPGQVLAFAEHIAVRPAEVAMVGDSPHDMEAARRAGAVAIAVRSGPMHADAERLADLAVDTIDDLPTLFRQ